MDHVVKTEGIETFAHAMMNQEDQCLLDAIIPSLNQNDSNHDIMNVSLRTATLAPMTVNLIVDQIDEIKDKFRHHDIHKGYMYV